MEHTVDVPPIQPEQEWANAWTHGLSAALWCGVGGWLVLSASQDTGLAIACGVYALSVVATFTCSTLSHVFLKQPLLDRFRAWDQAAIYLMIIGTYTPITYGYAPEDWRMPLLILMWTAAIAGFYNKAIRMHRVHSISVVSYLLMGWLPAIPLITNVPLELAWSMLLGGIVYSLGVVFLMNDRRAPYLHAVWHLMVLTASLVHAIGIAWYVVQPTTLT
ncbi:hemolysin III family protein [Rhodopirellula sp. JC740]|uniref:Hemolysin III family protein n=1 Tax=Rhodopirellula halodulae TaxID=2894198 RepID=A0ABS8NLW3_9BACT|nr:hemolysin III family protein [Rhodopirellula sp. JC740]MCC9644540.1 hemolysin III family protein [Rhodopirellula sp. JC740]